MTSRCLLRADEFFWPAFTRGLHCAAVFLVFATALGQQSAGTNPFARALELYEQGKFKEAREEATTALSQHPASPFGLNLMGVILDQLQDFEGAEKYYQQALKLDANSVPFLNNVGSHYLQWGKPSLARRYFVRILRLHPQHFNANYQLAQLAVNAGEGMAAEQYLARLSLVDRQRREVLLLRARALLAQKRSVHGRAVLEQLARREPGNPAIAFSIGLVYYEHGLYRDAARSFSVATRLAPNEFEPYYNLGLAYERLKELDSAAGAFEHALQLQPASAEVLYHLGLVYSRQGQGEKALALLSKTQDLEAQKPEVALLLGEECLKQRFFPEAVEAFQQYLTQKPQDVKVRRPLGLAYSGLRNWIEAVDQLSRYLAARPRDAHAYLERAAAWKQLGHVAEAEKDLQQSLMLDPSSTEALLAAGTLELERKNFQRAARFFRRALARNPHQVDALYGLGRAYLELGKISESVPLLEKVTAASTRPDMHFALVSAYRQVGNTEKANAALRRWQGSIRAAGDAGRAEFSQRYIDYLRRVAEARPADKGIKERLIALLLKRGAWLQAQTLIQEMTSGPSSEEAHLRAGALLLDHGYINEALSHLDKTAASSSLPLQFRVSLARAYSQAKRDQTALEVLTNVPVGDTKSADFLNVRAHVFSRLGRYKEALQDYQEAIRLAPDTEAYYVDLAAFFIDNHASEAATKALEAARRIFPQSRKLLLVEAINFALSGNPRRAFELLKEAQKKWPMDSLLATVSGLAASFMGDRKMAALQMEQAVALGSDDPLPYYYLGLFESQSAEGNLEAGLIWADLALAKDSSFAAAHVLRGQLLLRLGEPARAVESLEQGVRLDAESAENYFVLSRAYAKAGEHAKAATALEESERLRRQARQRVLAGTAERQLLVRIQATP